MDRNGYIYYKTNTGINDWTCLLTGQSEFSGGGGGTSTGGLLLAEATANGTSNLTVGSIPVQVNIEAVDINGQGMRKSVNWTANNNTITWIDQGTGFPNQNYWVRVWYRESE
jgi:hypothetical protein